MKWLLLTALGAWLVFAPPRDLRPQALVQPTSNVVGIYHAFPTESADSSQCIIGYRVIIGDLLFRQRVSSSDELIAYYTATIELRDTLGVVRYARVFRDSVIRRVLPDRFSDDATENVDTVRLANGTYSMSVDITQEQRQRLIWQTTVTFGTTPEHQAGASLGFASPQEPTDRFCLESWGKVVPFGARRVLIVTSVPRSWSGRDVLTIRARLRQQYFPFYRGTDTAFVTPSAYDERSLMARPLGTIVSEREKNLPCVVMLPSQQVRFVKAFVDVRRAIPGDYELEVIRSSTHDTLRVPFRIQWFAPPLHLFQSRYALAVMQYVLTEEEYRRLSDTPDSDRVAAIIRWWEGQDPTPSTRYNEAMVEYFRRAYQARTTFATAVEPDGALTERGKIYILFGAPVRIETNLEHGKPGTERWYYTNTVRKLFTFEVTTQGRYRLRSIESL